MGDRRRGRLSRSHVTDMSLRERHRTAVTVFVVAIRGGAAHMTESGLAHSRPPSRGKENTCDHPGWHQRVRPYRP
jgi:hypothetical protein